MAAPADVGVPGGAPATGEAPTPGSRRSVLQLRVEHEALVPLAATVLVVAHLALRVWTAAGGWYTGLDLAGTAGTVTGVVDVPGPPGAAALTRALASVAPLSWPAAVGLELLGQLLVDVALYRLLTTLFGRRPAVLLPLAVYLSSSLPLLGGVWWSAATVQLPTQLALLGALTAHVRYLRTRSPWAAAASAFAVAVGALFHAGVVLVPLLLVTVTALWWTEGAVRARVSVLARLRTAWLLHLLAVAVALGLRALLEAGSPVDLASVPATLRDLPGTLTRTVLPGLVGGPWVWSAEAVPLAVPAPPAAVVWTAGLVVAGVVVATVVLLRGALRAWLVAAAVTVVAVVVRDGSGLRTDIGFPPVAAVPPAALALTTALLLGLACLPVQGAPAVLHRRARTGRGTLGTTVSRLLRPAVGATAVAVLAVASVLSTAAFRQLWTVNDARDYVETAQAQLADRPDVLLTDSRVPDSVVPDSLAPADDASALLSGLPVPPRFLGEATVVPELAVLDDEGRIQLGYVAPLAVTGPGPVEGCGWPAGASPADVPLDGATADDRWYLHLSYFAGEPNTVWITAGDTRAGAVLDSGVHEVFVQVTGEVDRVRVEVEDPQRPICVTTVQVGSVRPLPPEER